MAIDFYETVGGHQFINSTMNSLRSLPDIADYLQGIKTDLDKIAGIEEERHLMEKEKIMDDIKTPAPEDILKKSMETKKEKDDDDDGFVWMLVRTDSTATDLKAEAFRDLRKAQDAMIRDIFRQASLDVDEEKKKGILSMGFWDDNFFGKNDGVAVLPLQSSRIKNDETIYKWKIIQVDISPLECDH